MTGNYNCFFINELVSFLILCYIYNIKEVRLQMSFNANYLPKSDVVFTVMFLKKELC